MFAVDYNADSRIDVFYKAEVPEGVDPENILFTVFGVENWNFFKVPGTSFL